MPLIIKLQSITYSGDARTAPRFATVTHEISGSDAVAPFEITANVLIKPTDKDGDAVEFARACLHHFSQELASAVAGWNKAPGGTP